MYEVRDIHIEPTQKCQASCSMCDRNANGGEVNKHLENKDISLEEFKEWFPPEALRWLNHIYFCGNHGDPIFCPDLLEICKYIKEEAPNLSTKIVTNGGARPVEWWSELAKYVGHVNFSVDGLWDTNHIYRQGVQWSRVEENIDAFTSAGGDASWTFIVFNYNEHQVEEAEEYSKLLGVNKFIVKKSGRYVTSNLTNKRETHQAVNRKGEKTALLSQPKNDKYRNKEIDNKYDPIVEKFGSMDKFLEVAPIDPKCVKKKEIYVSASGLVTPCCWINGQIFKWWRDKEESPEYQMLGDFSKIDLHHHSLYDIMHGEYFEEIKDSWTNEKRLKVCAMKCNIGFDPFSAQWK